jgi:Mg/Co/Ni transporter MgtE
MSKLTEEQQDALEELLGTYKDAHRTPEHAVEDVNNVSDLINNADSNADNELFSDLNNDLQELVQEVSEYEDETMSADMVEYFYNKIGEIANSYKF